MMDEQAKEVMRITRTGIWVNPDMAVDDAAKAVLNTIDAQIKVLVQKAVEDEREACAKVCDKEQEFVASGGPYVFSARRCATNIRARGDK